MVWVIAVLLFVVNLPIIAKEDQDKTNAVNNKGEITPHNTNSPNSVYVVGEHPNAKNQNEKADSINLLTGINQTENYLSDILNRQSGVTLNRYGAPGSFSALSLRSSYAHQTNIYIDGILLNDALGGFVNLEELSLDLFGQVELYRSYIPTHLIGNNIGGALDLIPNFHTDSAKKKRSLSYRIFGQSLYGGGVGLRFATRNQVHIANFEGGLNQYAYLDDNGTKLINFTDDTIRQRHNEDYLQGGYSGIFRIPMAKKNFKLFLSYFGKKRGIPGPIGLELDSVRYESHRFIIKPSLNYALSSRILLNISTGLTGQYSYLEDAKKELVFLTPDQRRYLIRAQGSINPIFFFFSEKLIINTTFAYAYNQLFLQKETLGRRSEIDNGISIKYADAPWLGYFVVGGKYSNVRDTPGKVYRNILFVQPSLDTKNTHLLGGNLRWGMYPLHLFRKLKQIPSKDQATGRLRNKKNQKKKPLEIFMMVSYGQRTPSLSENYGDGAFLLPNSELEAESSLTYTVGLLGGMRCTILLCSFNISYFHTRSQNLIILISNSSRSAKYFNISGSYSHGVELDFQLAYSNYVKAGITSSFLRAIDDSNIPFYQGKFLPFKPIYALNTYLEGGLKWIKSFVSFIWQTQLYRDRFNQRANLIPSRFLLDIGIIYSFLDKTNGILIFKVKNVLGQLQSDVLNYPLPGRVFEFKYTGRWYS